MSLGDPLGNPLGNPLGLMRVAKAAIAKKIVDIDCSPRGYATSLASFNFPIPDGYKKLRVTIIGKGGNGFFTTSSTIGAGGGGGGCAVSPVININFPLINVSMDGAGTLRVLISSGAVLDMSATSGGGAVAGSSGFGVGGTGIGGEFNFKGGDGAAYDNSIAGGGGGGATPDGNGANAVAGSGVGGDSGSGPNTCGKGGRSATSGSSTGAFTPAGFGGGGGARTSVSTSGGFESVLGGPGLVRLELW